MVRRAQASLPHAQATSSAPTVSPEIAIPSGTWHASIAHEMPAVAAGNGIYFVAFTQRVYNSGDYDYYLLGVRVRASDGALLDSNPLHIATGSTAAIFPAVAFDGTNFLVVWSDPPLIYGKRVRASDGAVLDAPVLISRPAPGPHGTPMPHLNPTVAFDGTHYLVVWKGAFWINDSLIGDGILGSWVNPSTGQLVNSTSFLISDRNGSPPRVAAGGGRHLVVWSDTRNSETPNVYGVRIDAVSRQVLDTTPRHIVTSMSISEENPTVASDGSNFLVLWRTGNGRLEKLRVRGSDGALLDVPTALGEASSTPAALTFDGRDYRAVWKDVHSEMGRVFTTRVSTAGETRETLLVHSALGSSATLPSVAAITAGRFLVVHNPGAHRVKARLVQDVQDEEPCEDAGPTLVLNGSAEMTLECQAGTYSDPGAQAFDGCGNPLTVHAYNTGNDSSGPGPNPRVEGTYTVSYAAWDAAGQTVNASRLVHVDDRVAPTLALRGPAHMTHTCNSPWVDPGVEAMDACYGDLSHTVWRTGEVNGWAEGTYTLTYTLTDGGGNSAAPVTRTVEVVDCPW